MFCVFEFSVYVKEINATFHWLTIVVLHNRNSPKVFLQTCKTCPFNSAGIHLKNCFLNAITSSGYTGKLRPEDQLLTCFYSTLTERHPFRKPFLKKRYFSSHAFYENTASLSKPLELNCVQYYGITLSITRRDVNQKTSICIVHVVTGIKLRYSISPTLSYTYVNLRNRYLNLSGGAPT